MGSSRLLALLSLCGAACALQPCVVPFRAQIARSRSAIALLPPTHASSALLGGVVVDTVLDVGVYSLLAGVVGLTLYSVFVTVDEGNRKAGGWQKREGEDEMDELPRYGEKVPTDVESRLRSGAVYDPVKDEWTFKEQPAAKTMSSSSSKASSVGAEVNRYERRARSKAKAREKAKSKKNGR